MGLFRRGASVRDTDDAVPVGDDAGTADAGPVDAGAVDAGIAADGAGPADPASADDPAVAAVPADPAATGAVPLPGGPWDVSDVDGIGRRLDLGAIWLPGVPGMQLRMEVDEATKQVKGVHVSMAGSALQVAAFAAPRTEGIWDEIRAEIAESVTKQGGAADELSGPFGRELLARMPVRTAEGRTGHRPARIVGHDGPRWFLRGVLSGPAAVDPQGAAMLERLFADIVVVRGTEARAPRDLLALRLPGQRPGAATPAAAPATPQLDPLTRGPEITETR